MTAEFSTKRRRQRDAGLRQKHASNRGPSYAYALVDTVVSRPQSSGKPAAEHKLCMIICT